MVNFGKFNQKYPCNVKTIGCSHFLGNSIVESMCEWTNQFTVENAQTMPVTGGLSFRHKELPCLGLMPACLPSSTDAAKRVSMIR